jgi:hypothetical protein
MPPFIRFFLDFPSICMMELALKSNRIKEFRELTPDLGNMIRKISYSSSVEILRRASRNACWGPLEQQGSRIMRSKY